MQVFNVSLSIEALIEHMKHLKHPRIQRILPNSMLHIKPLEYVESNEANESNTVGRTRCHRNVSLARQHVHASRRTLQARDGHLGEAAVQVSTLVLLFIFIYMSR